MSKHYRCFVCRNSRMEEGTIDPYICQECTQQLWEIHKRDIANTAYSRIRLFLMENKEALK